MEKYKRNLEFGADDSSLKGFHEVVFSVSNLEREITFYKNTFGWELAHKGQLDPPMYPFWQLDTSIKIEEALLVNKGDTKGYLRLVKFHVERQQQIRSGAQIWDSGGIYDINVRVKDMDHMYRKVQKQGWNGTTDPTRFTFGKFEVTEVLTKGPDGVVVAMMQRHKPTLEGFEFEKASRIFNSTTICADYGKTKDFFINGLGFQLYFETDGKSRSHGPNVIGIPPNINGNINVPVCIVHPNGKNEGSLELLHTRELTGKNCSALAQPPNLGILMYRFPVRDAHAYANQLKKRGIVLNTEVQQVNIPPYGAVFLFSVRSPDGVWIEFIQLLKTTDENN